MKTANQEYIESLLIDENKRFKLALQALDAKFKQRMTTLGVQASELKDSIAKQGEEITKQEKNLVPLVRLNIDLGNAVCWMVEHCLVSDPSPENNKRWDQIEELTKKPWNQTQQPEETKEADENDTT